MLLSLLFDSKNRGFLIRKLPLLERHSRLVIFDLDKTLVKANTSFAFCTYLYRKKVLSLRRMVLALLYSVKYHLLDLSLEELHKQVFKGMLKGFSLDVLEKEALSFLPSFIKKSLYFPAISALRLAQQLGHYTVILSNSPTFLVGPLAKFFGVNEWGATIYQVDKDRCLCNIAELMEGTKKAGVALKIANRLGLSRESITIYTDSYHDLPLLFEGGESVAVNPDSKLLQVAKQHQWRVI